jgi:1,4-alpha-glucan branching enzyme
MNDSRRIMTIERRRKMAKKANQKTGSRTNIVRFDFHAPDAQIVSLAGDFNGWDVNALPMKKDKKGNWKASVNLAPGRYEYRFYADGTWQDDPNAQERVDTSFGGQNSVRIVGGREMRP